MASTKPTEPNASVLHEVRAAPLPLANIGAVERIYERHYRDVYRYVLALTRSREDAEEVVGDTFERAMRSWDEVPATPLPWLLLTARRIATDRWRRARRLTRILVIVRGPAFEDQTGFWLWFDALAKVLTARQREALVLRYQADLQDSDIASILNVSESGVRSLVSRGLQVLRSHPELRG